MSNRWEEMKRRAALDRMRKMLLGDNPASSSSEDAKQAQRAKIAEYIRAIFDAGYDPMVIIEMMIGGLCFMADNHHVSREQVARAVRELQLAEDRQLIYSPA